MCFVATGLGWPSLGHVVRESERDQGPRRNVGLLFEGLQQESENLDSRGGGGTPLAPATQETEVGQLEPRNSQPAWATTEILFF